MSSQILTSGLSNVTFEGILSEGLRKTKPSALGVAVAYVSAPGFGYIHRLAESVDVRHLRLVTDTKDGVTHPAALRSAAKKGWDVRIVSDLPGTFHPKLYIGGSGFDRKAGITDLSFVLVGSANLSISALRRNGECSHLGIAPHDAASAGIAWKECWDAGAPLTRSKLNAYEKYFESRNRFRRSADLEVLGVFDPVTIPRGSESLRIAPPRDDQKAIATKVATTAWAGLESFTGDYDLQVEFPRDAGSVLRRLLGRSSTRRKAALLCEDGEERQFVFGYYQHNGMFRLNVPNSVPGVAWVRKNKRGIAIVEANSKKDRLNFRIIHPGKECSEVVNRSRALGTWGRTSTRLYGWY